MNELQAAQNSKIELAKALLAIKSIATSADYDKVRSVLLPTQATEAVDNAIGGLSKEHEFALMCRLMGTATHLVHLEQRPTIEGDFLIPDFFARFQPGSTLDRKSPQDFSGYRCLVEVKSTKNMEFKIGGQKLKRLRAFADTMQLPLIFAVISKFRRILPMAYRRRFGSIKIFIEDNCKQPYYRHPQSSVG